MPEAKILLLSMILLLSGCSNNTLVSPYDMHSRDIPLSETALILSVDQKDPDAFGAVFRVVEVDGVNTECSFSYGCPIWVRVSPGFHNVKVQAKTHQSIACVTGGQCSWLESTFDVPIHNAKPRHVYMARYTGNIKGGTIKLEFEDLGENSNFSLRFPPYTGQNAKYYPAKF